MKKYFPTYKLVAIALMASMTFVCTLIQFPLLESKVHLGNTLSILAGFLLTPVDAGLAAGLGSALYDATLGGYDVLGCGITFVSKFLMAFVCSLLAGFMRKKDGIVIKSALAYMTAAVSALTYVALYMLKTFIMKQAVDGLTLTAVGAVMLAKLPASLINAAFATFVAPPLYAAVVPALDRAGIMAKLK